jgi:hypothetical protein
MMNAENQTQAPSSQMMSLAVRLRAGKMSRIEGSDVFSIAHGWQAELLQKEAGISVVSSPTEFEQALQDEGAATVFVPRAAFGWTLLERILRRNDVAKTVFWEV